MSNERQQVALEATWEIESIARHLNTQISLEPDDMFLRALVSRLYHLNSVVMSVLSGDTRTTEDMQRVIAGIPNCSKGKATA